MLRLDARSERRRRAFDTSIDDEDVYMIPTDLR